VAIDIEDRRRRRDQRLAVQAANDIVQEAAARGRTITLEWAGVAALLAGGLALVLGAWNRHLPMAGLAEAAWAGLVFGGLLANAMVQRGRTRLGYLALAIFAGLPLAAIPFRFVTLQRELLPLVVIAALGAAVLGGALRWVWELRATLDTLRESLARARDSLGTAAATLGRWLRDALLKWIYAFLLILIGAGLGFVGRQQQRELLFWAGAVVIFLIGSVGLWAPGVHNRPRLAVGLRHCGQLCFWLSLLVVPFVEAGPDGTLPYGVRPSVRFIAMGLGLVVIGSTWLLQRTSIFSHHLVRERKRPAERACALAVVILGLLVTLVGADLRQRMQFTVDDKAISVTDPLGRVRLRPLNEVRSVLLVQRLENVPIFFDYVEFQDGTSYQVVPMLYPGNQYFADQHGLVLAVRAAAQLNSQSFPLKGVEQWAR